jgi:hypothetical protein
MRKINMTLDELKQTRRRLRAAEAAAASAVQRAEKEVADELFNVRERERPVEAARDREAFDAATLVLESAQKDHALALKRLSDRKGEHAHAEMEARTAEAMVVRAVDKVLRDEIVERANQVAHHLDEALRLGTKLKHFSIAAAIDAIGIVPESTVRVLDRLYGPLIDARDIAINLEKLGDVPAFRDWRARRERMIAGDGVQEDVAA